MFSTATAATVFTLATALQAAVALRVPRLQVPACPQRGTIQYDRSVPNKTAFALTQVDLCYRDSSIDIAFTAYNESSFFVNASQTTNEAIYEYEVMEAFISQGARDPQTYLEFEVNPINVTYQAFVYNPSKVRAEGAPFDHFFIADPLVDSLTADTTVNKAAETWVSNVRIPLGFFNVDNCTAKGTEWRMNFFRTVTNPSLYPDQLLGAWSVPNKASFHITPYFGHVKFV